MDTAVDYQSVNDHEHGAGKMAATNSANSWIKSSCQLSAFPANASNKSQFIALLDQWLSATVDILYSLH